MSVSAILSSSRAYILLVVLLLPVFLIGIRDTTDWGDDFAGYLQAAQNLSHHQPAGITKYVAFEHYHRTYAPPTVPIGFPLLLVPVVKAWGLNFKALNYYMSFWLYLFAFACFNFLRRYLSTLSSVCLTLIFFLNPSVLTFKSEILSDLPFAFFFTLSLILYLKNTEEDHLLYQVLFGISAAFLISIRAIGACIFVATGIDLLRQWIGHLREESYADSFRFILRRSIWVLPFVGIYGLISMLAGQSGSSSFSFYTHIYQGIHVWELMMMNLDIYISYFLQLFDHDAGIYGFGLTITKAALLFCFVLGLLSTIWRGYSILLVFFLTYTLAILIYPVNKQGFRFFFPLLPLIILFIAYGARTIRIPSFPSRIIWVPIVTVLILLQYRSDLVSMHDHQSAPVYPTPVSAECMAGFARIHALSSDSDLILSLKPRACALFADRPSCVLPEGDGAAMQSAKLSISKPTLILLIRDIDNDRIASLVNYERDSAIYEDSKFILYSRNHTR